MFDLDRFIADCKAAIGVDAAQKAIRELLREAVAEPSQIIRALGEPKKAGIELLYRSNEVTIINVVWGPRMTAMPHNHHMWAAIGMYGGREDNIFWRTLPEDARWPLEAAGASALMSGDVCPLGKDIIHSVTNPLSKLSSAIHIYGGDFVAQKREQWEEETFHMRPYDPAEGRRMFEEANRLIELTAAAWPGGMIQSQAGGLGPLVDTHAHIYPRTTSLIESATHKPARDVTSEEYVRTLDEHGPGLHGNPRRRL